MRDWIFARVHRHFSAKTGINEGPSGRQFQLILFERGFVLEKEGRLTYAAEGQTGAKTLSHKSDLLLSVFDKKMRLSPVFNVEVKYRSCVSDAFKARAYDQIHLKQTYPHLVGLLIFVKPHTGGVSIERARLISYPFDAFWTVAEVDLSREEIWSPLFELFENRMKAVAADPQIESPFFRAIE